MTKTKFLSSAFLILAITAYFGDDDTDLAVMKAPACSSAMPLPDPTLSARDLLGQIEQRCIDMKSGRGHPQG